MRSILEQKGILIARLPVLYDVIFLREMSRNNSIKFDLFVWTNDNFWKMTYIFTILNYMLFSTGLPHINYNIINQIV